MTAEIQRRWRVMVNGMPMVIKAYECVIGSGGSLAFYRETDGAGRLLAAFGHGDWEMCSLLDNSGDEIAVEIDEE